MQFNFQKTKVEIISSKTGKIYFLNRADCVDLDTSDKVQIAKVCDEPEIYDNLFAPTFKGTRYTLKDADFFTKYITEGWKNKNHFDWLILQDDSIVGTLGIKTLEGEIGYWQSSKHPGVMTSAVRALCNLSKEAGFSSLWAYVKKDNAPSIGVLQNAGFKLDKELTAKRGDAFGYRSSF